MLKELSRLHVDPHLAGDVSEILISGIMTVAALTGLLYMKNFVSYILTKAYEMLIQKNIFNL
jgi:hypothetical protein